MNAPVFLCAVLAGAIACALVAARKNRNVGAWCVSGALFPLISVIVLCAVRALPRPGDAS